MNSLTKSVYVGLFVIAFAAVFALATPVVHADDYFGGCDFCGGYTDYYGSNDYTDYYGYNDYTDYYGSNDYIDEYGVEYSYVDYYDSYSSYSTPSCYSCGGSKFSYIPPIKVTPPTYYPPQKPQPPVYIPPAPQPPSVITTNSCVGNSCNTNVNNINNSVSGSYNTTTLTPATPQYLVQYVAPQPVPVQNLYCTITASPSFIQNGQAAFLSWTSVGATNAWLSDGIGYVAPNGSLAVRPNVSTTYTLTVNGYGGTRTCSAYVNVSGTYVSLTQIPYTGFDFGPFGNAVYLFGLLAFASALAYLVLYYKGGTAVVAGSLFGSTRSPQAAAKTGGSYGSIPTPAMFSRSTRKTFTSAPVQSRSFDNLPIARADIPSPKDSMTAVHSDHGQAPRIVVNRG